MTRTRSISTCALLLLSVVACQPPVHHEMAPSFTSDDEAAIRSMLERYVEDVNAEDWDALVEYYVDDAVRMPPNEPVTVGKAEIVAWNEALAPVTGFTLMPQVVDGDGNLAWARGEFALDLAPPDADPVNMIGKWMAVYRRQADGSWLCVSDIWNTDAPVPM